MGLAEYPIMVVVVAYGIEDQLERCLDALGPGLPVVVVDNGGSERARQVSIAAGATYVRPASNIGFAAAVNVALRDHRADACDVLLLNPDARLPPSDLALMRKQLHTQRDLAATGPRLVNPDGSSQKSEWPMPSPWTALASVMGVADRLARRRFVGGAALLLRGEAIDAVGTLDERYFLYAEESDWQLRALRAGWRVCVTQDATAVHASGATSSDQERRELLFNASAERFIRKWYGTFGWQVFRAASIVAGLRRLVFVSGGRQSKATHVRAITHYWRGPVRYADAIGDGP
jgi:GT2 family glycosyltransferase